MKHKYDSIEKLNALVSKLIDRNKPHAYYDYTVELAKLYRAAVTGEGQDDYIFRYKDKETKAQKERRIRFHHPRTKSTCNRIMAEFDRLDHNDNTIDITKYLNDDDGSRLKRLSEKLECYDVDFDAKSYIINFVKELNFIDPNAFIVNENEDGFAYPIIYFSEQVYDFEYSKGELQYLVTFEDSKGVNGIEYRTFTVRAPGYGVKVMFNKKTKSIISINEYATGTSHTPAIRIGYKLDPKTTYNTAVGILEPATEELKGLMWTGSEEDLHKKNHYFLQKFVYAPRCEFQRTTDAGLDVCQGGTLSLSKEKCPSGCQNGYALHKTVSDIIAIKTPATKDQEVVPLSQRVHYVEVPTSLVDGIKEDIKEFENRVFRAIFNADLIEKSQLAETATQAGINVASKYPVYSKVGQKISNAIELVVQTTAEYNNIAEGLINVHKFPSDWQLEAEDTLISRRAAMIAASSPRHQLKSVDRQLNRLIYKNNPNDLARVESYENHLPFSSLPSNVLQSVLMSLDDRHPDKVLYYYFDQIIREVENGLMSKKEVDPPQFYELTYEEQKKLVEDKVQEFIERQPIDQGPEPIQL